MIVSETFTLAVESHLRRLAIILAGSDTNETLSKINQFAIKIERERQFDDIILQNKSDVCVEFQFSGTLTVSMRITTDYSIKTTGTMISRRKISSSRFRKSSYRQLT